MRAGNVGYLPGLLLERLRGARHLFLGLDAHRHQHLREFGLHDVEKLLEQLEGLAAAVRG